MDSEGSGEGLDTKTARAGVAPGGHLGPYRIEAALGAGGMGEVHRAYDPRLHRTVAIKDLPRDKMADPERKRRFLQEARRRLHRQGPPKGARA